MRRLPAALLNPRFQRWLTVPRRAVHPNCRKCSCTDFSFPPPPHLWIEILNKHTPPPAAGSLPAEPSAPTRHCSGPLAVAAPVLPTRHCVWRWTWSLGCIWVRKKTALSNTETFSEVRRRPGWGSAFRNNYIFVPQVLGWHQKCQGLVKEAVLLQQREK